MLQTSVFIASYNTIFKSFYLENLVATLVLFASREYQGPQILYCTLEEKETEFLQFFFPHSAPTSTSNIV